jgi:hypothetical protein
MLSKKSLSFIFVVAFSFIAASALSAQENANDIMLKFLINMPENCQDAISRFPANLQNGFQGAYLSLTTLMGQSDELVLKVFNSFLMANYIKTNIILQGKGSEKYANTDKTFSQQYTELRVAGLQSGAMLQMAAAMSGNLSGANAQIWGNRLMEWL